IQRHFCSKSFHLFVNKWDEDRHDEVDEDPDEGSLRDSQWQTMMGQDDLDKLTRLLVEAGANFRREHLAGLKEDCFSYRWCAELAERVLNEVGYRFAEPVVAP
ncbi:hypothetical protein HK097_002551, partial [Rhizophlyctis rosea]